jgi:hypothetical protein
MKVITVSQDCVIDDVFYRQGEVVRVSDNFSDSLVTGKTLLSRPDAQLAADNIARIKWIQNKINRERGGK